MLVNSHPEYPTCIRQVHKCLIEFNHIGEVIHMILADKIIELRKRSGMSQEELAASLQLIGLDITQKTISRIETGNRVVPDYELIYFSKLFDIPVEDLLHD